MKKRILVITLTLFSALLLVACKPKAPVFEGVGDVEHRARVPFDAMEGVTAIDKKDGDLTDKVEVEGFEAVDITTVGDYELVYRVTNSKDLTTEVTRVVTIYEPDKAPVFKGVVKHVLAKGEEFDPLTDVTATSEFGESLTVSVKGNVDTETVGKYELIYEATDDRGITGYAQTQVLVVEEEDIEKLANGTYNFKFADADTRHTFFAAAERYLLETMNGGIPYYVANSYSLLSERVELPVEVFIPSYGWGTRLANITKDDSEVKDVEGNEGEAGKYTNRTWDTSTFATLNYWVYDDSVSADYLNPITGGFYRQTLNATNTGWEFVPDLAADRPKAVNDNEQRGNVTSKTWEITLRDDLEWAFHPDVDTDGLDMALTAEDFVWTYREALNQNFFRAISGGGDLAKEIVGAEDYSKIAAEIYDGPGSTPTAEQLGKLDDAWEKVGIKLVDDYTIQFELKEEKGEFDVFYAISWPAMHRGLYERVGTDYGKDHLNIASSGEYVMVYHERDKLTKFVKNDKYPHAEETMWTGLDIIIYDDVNVAFQAFLDGKLESAGVPNERISEFIEDTRLLQTPDATTWRLNINGLKTVEAQQAQFPGSTYVPEPILGFQDFKKALYYIIDRQELQQNWVESSGIGTTFFSDAYYVDPESGIPYRSTEQGQAVFDEFGGDTWGYNKDVAINYLKSAVRDAIAEGHYEKGTKDNPTEITLEVRFMSLTTSEATKLRADFVKESFENLIDDENHVRILVDIVDTPFPNIYYDYQMLGNFDIAIGGISGSALDASSFLDVFASDDRGGFTINWGFDTSLPEIEVTWIDEDSGEEITELFSYDAIVSALNGTIDIENGMEAPLWEEEVDTWDEVLGILENNLGAKVEIESGDDLNLDKFALLEERNLGGGVWLLLDEDFTEEDVATWLEDNGFNHFDMQEDYAGNWVSEWVNDDDVAVIWAPVYGTYLGDTPSGTAILFYMSE